MIEIDHPHVRRLRACPRCNGEKDSGLLLCWPCHRYENYHNDGGYSPAVERLLRIHEQRHWAISLRAR